jgi:hypothetical protein
MVLKIKDMNGMKDTCCHNNHSTGCTDSHSHENIYEDAVNDPTLASCCAKDLQEYRQAMNLKRVLTEQDPTSGGVRLRQNMFQPTLKDVYESYNGIININKGIDTVSIKEKEEEEEEEEEDEFDYLLDEMEDKDSSKNNKENNIFLKRRREMEEKMRQTIQNAQDGYGIVNVQSSFQDFLKELKQKPQIPRIVFFSKEETLDQQKAIRNQLYHIATKYLGSKFYCIHTLEDFQEYAQLNTLPSLVTFRKGEKVDALCMPIQDKWTDDFVWEGRILPWLTMCGVLEKTRQDLTERKGRCKKDREEEEEELAGGFDCGKQNCRLRFSFEHEHVGPSEETKENISAWRK